MTFNRAIVIAMMANLFGHCDGRGMELIFEYVLVMLIGSILWHLTTDPLPGAIERGLDAYAKKWRGQ
jgi:hypothetical protein